MTKLNAATRLRSASTSDLEEAIESWFEMWKPEEQAKVILESPEAQKFKHASGVTEVFRCVVLDSSGHPQKSTASKLVVYTTQERRAHEFYNSLDTTDPYIVVKKKYHPSDLLLNFHELAKSLDMSGGWDEYELWMKPTPYYTKYAPEEIVFSSSEN